MDESECKQVQDAESNMLAEEEHDIGKPLLDSKSVPSQHEVQHIFQEHCDAVRQVLSEHIERATDAIVQQTMRLHVSSLDWGSQEVAALHEAVRKPLQQGEVAKTASQKSANGQIVATSSQKSTSRQQRQLKRAQIANKLRLAIPNGDAHGIPRFPDLSGRAGGDSVMRELKSDGKSSKSGDEAEKKDPSKGLKAFVQAARALIRAQPPEDDGIVSTSSSLGSEAIVLPNSAAEARVSTHIHFCQVGSDFAPVPRKSNRASDFPQKGVFADPDDMKQALRSAIVEPEIPVEDYYWDTGWCQSIARHHIFELLTLSVIFFNCFWIAVDVDLNTASSLIDAHPAFIIADNFFCLYFLAEWSIRWGAFRRKINCVKDHWFLFDTVLCILMVLDTWVLTIVVLLGDYNRKISGNSDIFRSLRLVRLARMSRVARLLRAFPELMIVVTGLRAAVRAVAATVVLMILIIYVFAIFLRQVTDGTVVGKRRFPTVQDTMRYLLLSGTVPDQESFTNEIWDEGGTMYAMIYLVFAMIITITIMNMLVGVLVGVVQTVSELEKEQLVVKFVKNTILKLLQDDDNNHMLSRDEFARLVGEPAALRSFNQMGVDVVGLCDLADYIFAEGRQLPIQSFMELLMELRGSNVARVKDIVDMRKFFHLEMDRLQEDIEDLLEGLNLPHSSKECSRKTSPLVGLLSQSDYHSDAADVSQDSEHHQSPKSQRKMIAGPLEGLLTNFHNESVTKKSPKNSRSKPSARTRTVSIDTEAEKNPSQPTISCADVPVVAVVASSRDTE